MTTDPEGHGRGDGRQTLPIVLQFDNKLSEHLAAERIDSFCCMPELDRETMRIRAE